MLLDDLTQLCDQLLKESRSTAAVAACDKALAESLPELERCRVLQLKAEALTAEDGKWGGPSILCLKEALILAGADPLEQGRVHCALTAGYAAKGSVSLCRSHQQAFMALLKTTPALSRWHPAVQFNMALALHEREMLGEAERAYTAVRELCRRSEDPGIQQRVAYIDHNIVDCLLELKRYDEAKYLMDLSNSKLPDEIFGAQTRNRRAIYALEEEEDLDGAVLWVESGLGHPACDTKTRAALTLTKAKIALVQGREVAANDLGLEAMRLAAIAWSSRLGGRASRFLNEMAKGV